MSMKGKKGPLANGPRKGARVTRSNKVQSLPKPGPSGSGKGKKGGYRGGK